MYTMGYKYSLALHKLKIKCYYSFAKHTNCLVKFILEELKECSIKSCIYFLQQEQTCFPHPDPLREKWQRNRFWKTFLCLFSQVNVTSSLPPQLLFRTVVPWFYSLAFPPPPTSSAPQPLILTVLKEFKQKRLCLVLRNQHNTQAYF